MQRYSDVSMAESSPSGVGATSPDRGSQDLGEEETPGPQANLQDSELTQDQWTAIKLITDSVHRYRTKECVLSLPRHGPI